MCNVIKTLLSYLTAFVGLPDSQNRRQEKGCYTFRKTFSVLPLIIHNASLDFNLVLSRAQVKAINKNMYIHYQPRLPHHLITKFEEV